jgi:catechol 2,3-dioxygenase-like lactoylglutathione lyase family enzyme
MIGRVYTVVLDCPDPAGLADFYSELTGLPRTRTDDDWVDIGGDDGTMRISFQQAVDLLAPKWPDPAFPQQFHLDIEVDDIDEAEPAVLKLGARRLAGEGQTFRVYEDPAGHPFCLVWAAPDGQVS